MREKIILDVDTGSDDAIAIMVAALSDKIDLLGVSTVNGNRCIEITTANTLRLISYLGLNTPVYRGCHLPMVASLLPGRRKRVPFTGPEIKEEDVHGDYLPLPETDKKAEPIHAVNWLISTLNSASEPITLVFVGPLTNLAMALRLDPEITRKIKKIIIMGGGYQINNITAGAEFNFWIDPEAAKIVADCGVPLDIVPLDATHDAYVSLDQAEELIQLGTRASKFCGDLIRQRINGYNKFQPLPIPDTAPIHDALAVASIIDHEVLQSIMHVNMDVCISPGITDGMSLFDVEERDRSRPKNAYVACRSDRLRFFEILKQVLACSIK